MDAPDLTELLPGLWIATGRMAGPPHLPRNMVVWRAPDGTLVLHAVHPLTEAGLARLEGLGRPAVMIVSSPFHEGEEPAYKARYPGIRVVAPAAARGKIDTPTDAASEDMLPPLGIIPVRMPGVNPQELAYEFPVDGGRKVVAAGDAFFNMPHQPGFEGFILRLIGSTGFFGVSRIARIALVKDTARIRQWFLDLAQDTALAAVVPAHGEPVVTNLPARLREAAARLG